MIRSFLLVTAITLTRVPSHAQSEPSIGSTFEWMTNTLKPSEGNVLIMHHPYQRPYPNDWEAKELDPHHSELITRFSHDGCRVEFDVDVTDSDMGFSLGRVFVRHEVETFDLKDIDPTTVRTEDSCKPVETPNGPTKPWNCEDTQGKYVVFKTTNAKPKIHEEATSMIGTSPYGWQPSVKKQRDELCKAMPSNTAYCDVPEHKEKPEDKTSDMLGFRTPQYAQRFARALRRAIELCGGKPSAF